MPKIAAAMVLVVLSIACSGDPPSSLLTGPTPLAPGAASTSPLRTEEWRLELRIRAVLGAECEESVVGGTRSVDLEMQFAEDGTVAMRYAHPLRPGSAGAGVRGWTLEGGFEGSGLAYEGLPCSGASFEFGGAPTTLTGYFSDDGRSFSGVEVRRYLGRPAGEIVYHLEWRASR
jgi:hypothetical protein